MSSFEAFRKAAYRSIKQDSYFAAYDKVLAKYVGKAPVIVDVGILSGGSLFMWRDFLGPEARIIGVELNPAATKWREHGFEIFIGDQSSGGFWNTFFEQVGPIDILIDDGGHTNYQQLKTLHEAIPHVRDGGIVLIEDTHASYMKNFGNPSKYSFMNFCAEAVHKINDRYFYKGTANLVRDCVQSMEIFEGISVFNINRPFCRKSTLIDNGGVDDNAVDMRLEDSFLPKGKKSSLLSRYKRKVGQVREKIISYRFCRPFF